MDFAWLYLHWQWRAASDLLYFSIHSMAQFELCFSFTFFGLLMVFKIWTVTCMMFVRYTPQPTSTTTRVCVYRWSVTFSCFVFGYVFIATYQIILKAILAAVVVHNLYHSVSIPKHITGAAVRTAASQPAIQPNSGQLCWDFSSFLMISFPMLSRILESKQQQH